MRIGFVYSESDVFKFGWIADAAISLGHEVCRISRLATLAGADAECDLILFSHKNAALCVPDLLDLAKNKRSPWVQWWFDLIANERGKPLSLQSCLQRKDSSNVWHESPWLRVMRTMDLLLVKERAYLPQYHDVGLNACWMDQACPSDMPECEHCSEPEFDVLVVGQSDPRHKQRVRDAKCLVANGFKVAWVGAYGSVLPAGVTAIDRVPPKQLPEVVSRAGFVLSVDARHDIEGYWSDREWLLFGMGACVLRRFTAGLSVDQLKNAKVYQDHEMLLAHAGRLRGNAKMRKAYGSTARESVMARHTYEHRVAEVLELCTERLGIVPE